MKKGLLFHLNKWEEYVLFTVMLFMLTTLTVQVFCRYVLSFSFSWAEQSARIGFVWLTMIGISLAAKKGLHLRIDGLIQVLPKKMGICLDVFSDAVTMLFGIGMGYLIFKTVMLQIRTGQVFSSIPWLPAWTMYIAGVLGMFGLCFRTLERRIAIMKKGDVK